MELETELKLDSPVTTANITKLVVLVKFDSGDVCQVLFDTEVKDLLLRFLIDNMPDHIFKVSTKIDSIDF